MILARFRRPGQGDPKMGLVWGSRILEPAPLWSRDHAEPFPQDPVTLLAGEARSFCERLLAGVSETRSWEEGSEPLDAVELLSPILRPVSFRDFYSFEEHVRRARARRGLEVPREWYLRPTFYFSNPNSILGPGQTIPRPAATRMLDFEAEIGCVILRAGRDIPEEAAGGHIAGYTLINDWSARDVQREEMAVGLGPSKGKDFATSVGPFLVTPDELAARRAGKGFDLPITVRRNGHLLTDGNWSAIHYSFEEMIAHASRDVWLVPGDLLGSGTVGGGSILEIGPDEAGGWLEPGDLVEIEAGPFGVLRSTVLEAGGGEGDSGGR